MMLRGVSFVDYKSHPATFFQLLDKFMDLPAYDWYVDDVELNYFYFRPGRYSGSEFKSEIDAFSTLSFVRIRRYPVGTPMESIDTIDSYEDFVRSECDFMVLFYDGGDYEMYIKDEDETHRFFDSCLSAGYSKVEYKRDDDDPREYMHF